MRRNAFLGLWAGCVIVALFPISDGLAQSCQSYWTDAYKCAQGCGSCGTTNQGPTPYVPPPPDPAEIAAQQAYALNEEGIKAFSPQATSFGRKACLLRLHRRLRTTGSALFRVVYNRLDVG